MEEIRIYARHLRVGLFAVEPIRRAGLRSIFEEMPGVDLIDAGLEGLLAAESLDIAVISLMIHAEVITTIDRLRAATPAVRIIVMSEGGDDESVVEVVSAGAKGYLLDSATPEEVKRAVEVVASGSIWAPRKALSTLVDRIVDGETQPQRITPQFTQREREVLELLVSARSNREIAEELGIEVRTVKSYIGKMMRKVGVGNRIALSVHAATRVVSGGPGHTR